MQPGSPELSVVVPTHNRADRLESLLSSLSDQNGGADRFEVIVIDDASTDGTPELLERWSRNGGLALTVIRRERPGGAAAARNLGWARAHGELIGFIDDDCVAEEGWVDAGLTAWRANPSGFVQGRTDPMPSEADKVGPFSYTIAVRELGPYYESCNIFYPAELLRRLGGFDEAFTGAGGEDCDLAWRAIESGVTPVFAPEARALHAVHELGPAAHLRRAAHWKGTMRAFALHPQMRKRYLHRGVFWEVRHQMLLQVLVALLLPKRWFLLRALLAAPYFLHMRQRFEADRASTVVGPYYVLHDLIEMVAVVRGGIKYRMLVL